MVLHPTFPSCATRMSHWLCWSLFSKAWYKIVMQRSLVIYHGISHEMHSPKGKFKWHVAVYSMVYHQRACITGTKLECVNRACCFYQALSEPKSYVHFTWYVCILLQIYLFWFFFVPQGRKQVFWKLSSSDAGREQKIQTGLSQRKEFERDVNRLWEDFAKLNKHQICGWSRTKQLANLLEWHCTL